MVLEKTSACYGQQAVEATRPNLLIELSIAESLSDLSFPI